VTPGGDNTEETKDDQRDFTTEFRLKPTYYFDGRNQSLEEWIAREIPKLKVLVEGLQQSNDLCSARVKIAYNYSGKSHSEIFDIFEAKVQELRREMSKKVVSWTPQIEKQSKGANVKAIKSTIDGKHTAVLVAFGPDAKQRVDRVIIECKAVEEETKGQSCDIPDMNEAKP